MNRMFNSLLIFTLMISLTSCGGIKTTPASSQTKTSVPFTGTIAIPTDINPLQVIGQIGGQTQAVSISGNNAFVGVGYRMLTLNINDPSSPKEIGSSELLKGQVLDISIQGNFAYVAAGGAGLYIIDISNPVLPKTLGNFNSRGYSEGVIVEKNYAYLCDGPNGLVIVDISDPTQPQLISTLYDLNYVYDAAVQEPYVYLAAAGAGVLVADISDKAKPVEIGNFDTPGNAFGIAASGKDIYVADGWGGLQVLDASDIKNIKAKATHVTPGWAMDVTVSDNTVAVADSFGGLQLLDLSTQTTPSLTGLEFPGGHASKVAISGNSVFLADIRQGVHIVDITSLQKPIAVGSFTPMVYAHAVESSNGYVYVAAQDSGLKVIDVSDPTHPFEVATIHLSGPAVSVALSGTTAYVADYEYIYAVDVSNPLQPKISSPTRMLGHTGIATFKNNEVKAGDTIYALSRSLTIQGTTLFVACEWGLILYDISDHLAIKELSFIQTTTSTYSQTEAVAVGVSVYQDTAYLAVSHAGLYAINISDPSHPELLGAFSDPLPEAYGKKNSTVNIMDVVVAPPIAYVLDQVAVRALDISDPANIKGLGALPLPTIPFNNGGGASRSLVLDGKYLYVADNSAGLMVVDVSDPNNLKQYDAIHLPGLASWVFIDHGNIFVADGESGLFIVQNSKNPVTYLPSGSSKKYEAIAQIKNVSFTGNKNNAGISEQLSSPLFSVNQKTLTSRNVIVTSKLDYGPGTLREALDKAISGDNITFDPQAFPPDKPTTIYLNSQLPSIGQGSIKLDASNSGVILDGSKTTSGTVGLSISSNDNKIMGLQILNFPGDGVELGGQNNIVGGDRSKGNGLLGEGNLISGNRGQGINICCGLDTTENTIVGNYIGTDITGMQVMPNGVGVGIGSVGNTLGNINPSERNVISGNKNAEIETKNASGNLIIGNYIGLDASGDKQLGKPSGWSVAIWLASYNNRLEKNVIAGTLIFADPGTSYNETIGNFIGTDATGKVSLTTDASIVVAQPFNRIGGSNLGEGNIINGHINIERTSDTWVIGNTVNTDESGIIVFPRNPGWEISLTEGSTHNFIGGTTPLERNIINSGSDGVLVHLDNYANFNFVLGNSLGTSSSESKVFPNQTGISLENAESNFIQNNLIEGSQTGVSLSSFDYDQPGADFNLIKANHINQCSKAGIGIGQGDGNMIYRNTLDNYKNNAFDNGLNNLWDDGFNGNFWNDYSGVDTNGDGIGDSPYTISANGIDRFPLMKP